MHTTEFITRHGFRRWYERELVRGHAQLVLLLLCVLAVLGAVEAFGLQDGPHRLLLVVCLLVAAALGAWALRRYLFHLGLAEALAHQAVCPHCRAYARWQVDAAEPGSTGPPGRPGVLQVHCRACGGGWAIHC